MSEPVQVIRYGLVKCEIRTNKTRVGDRYSVTFSRLFKNGDLWSESKQFGREDLLLVAKVADLAHSWIYESRQSHPTTMEEKS